MKISKQANYSKKIHTTLHNKTQHFLACFYGMLLLNMADAISCLSKTTPTLRTWCSVELKRGTLITIANPDHAIRDLFEYERYLISGLLNVYVVQCNRQILAGLLESRVLRAAN